MSDQKRKSLGQAIDEVIAALEPLDAASRATVVRAACEHLGIGEADQHRPAPLESEAPNSGGSTAGSPKPLSHDIRSFRLEKQPKTAIEMACVVAYYLDSLAPVADRKGSISKADVEKYFKQAGQRLPKAIQQVLVDAKAAGYLDSADRGQYKLNPVGHNLVVHTLPRASEK